MANIENGLLKAEEELRLHSEIMKNLAEGVYLIRIDDGIIVYTNPRFEEMFGYDPGELIGKDVAIVNAPTDKPPEVTKEEIMVILSETGEWHGEILNIKKDGTPFWCYANVSHFDHPEYGKVHVSVHTDITARKAAEQKLKESEEKFRELFNNMSSGVAVYEAVENGRDFIFKDFNIAGQKIDNIKKDDLIGKSVLEMFSMVKEFGLFEAFQRVWNTGEPEFHPISQYKDERITRWRKNYVYKLPTGEIVAVYDDVTVQKQAEERLKETLETTKLMLESLPVGIFLIDYDKKIKTVNKVALKLLGIDSEGEILDQYCYNYVCVSEKNICPIIDLNKNADDSERCIINKAGNRIPILKSVIPIKLGSDNLLLEAFLDITPLKEIQSKLEESEKQAHKSYKEANFYKDLFAHDINNILNGIKGASELYLLYDNDSTKMREKNSLINIIKDQVIKGALLVSNVQKLSQLEEGKDVRLKEINAQEIMNKAKKYTQESFQERTINIDEYYFIKKPIVLANELLLDVFENLLNNAVKYNDSSIVKIQTKISRIIKKGKNYFKIEFIDNGIGVMNEKKEIIFKKGYMKEKGTKGMGFGLTLVKKLIKSYNGKIWVEDIVDGDYTQGSNFVILIPEAI